MCSRFGGKRIVSAFRYRRPIHNKRKTEPRWEEFNGGLAYNTPILWKPFPEPPEE